MSNHPAEPGEGADDLIGRWLAHHEKPSDDGEAPPPRRVPSAARFSEAVTPVVRPSASETLRDLEKRAIDRRDGLGPVAPPSSFGVKRGLPGSVHSGPSGEPDRNFDRGVAELDRPSPVGFEPVIIGSVRKKKDQPEPEKEKVGRLKRLRSRVAASADQETSTTTADVVHDEAVSLPPPPVFKNTPAAVPPPPVFETKVVESVLEVPVVPVVEAETQPAEAPPKRKVVAYEDMIALATMAALPDEPEPEPAAPALPPVAEEATPGSEDQPVTEPEIVVEPVVGTEPVLPGPELAAPPSPHQVLPEQQDDEVPPMTPAASSDAPAPPTPRRRLVARPKPQPEADEPKRRLVARARTAVTDTPDAARGMIAARAATPAPAPVPVPVRGEPVASPAATAVAVDTATPVAPRMEMPTVYEFAPLRASRRFLSLMLLVGLVASVYLGYGAYLSRDSIEIGIAGITTLATLVIWGIRAGASVTRLTVRSGQLEIVRQGARQVFDLTSGYTPIEVVGRPGSKKWKVMFLRRGMAPAVVDSTMVDGKDFMRILSFFHPELQPVKK